MLKQIGRRTSPATVIACLALFFAIAGGSAIALKGKNTVDSGDIKKGQVKTSDIANNAVTTKKIKGNAVRTSDIQNGQVRKADLAPDEPFHKVGTPGNPPFGNGGDGDCIWTELTQPPIGDPFNEPSFYKDAHGVVRLTGALASTDGPGGDGTCDDQEDGFIFTLPAGYRPPEIMAFTSLGTEQIVVIGSQDVVAPGVFLPAGTVALSGVSATSLILDEVSFRAAGPSTGLPRRGGTAHISAEMASMLGLD
jgi:hypothetical protein